MKKEWHTAEDVETLRIRLRDLDILMNTFLYD